MRDEILRAAVPSAFVRERNAAAGRSFSDAELATILWNAGHSWHTTRDLLGALVGLTADEALAEQLRRRLVYDESCLAWFADNTDQACVYVVVGREECGGELFEEPCGYFARLERAVAHGAATRPLGFWVERQLIVGDEELGPQRVGAWCPGCAPAGGDCGIYEDYAGQPLAVVRYDGTGELLDFEAFGMPEELRALYDEWDARGFERRLVEFAYPFAVGDIVREVTSGLVGVVTLSAEDYRDICARAMAQPGWADYFDGATATVVFACEDGTVGHGHSLIGALEPLTDDDVPAGMGRCLQEALRAEALAG